MFNLNSKAEKIFCMKPDQVKSVLAKVAAVKVVLISTEASSPWTKQPMKLICKEPMAYCWNHYKLDIFV
jgi:metal-sulfur cluster biosynthetic enzyme